MRYRLLQRAPPSLSKCFMSSMPIALCACHAYSLVCILRFSIKKPGSHKCEPGPDMHDAVKRRPCQERIRLCRTSSYSS